MTTMTPEEIADEIKSIQRRIAALPKVNNRRSFPPELKEAMGELAPERISGKTVTQMAEFWDVAESQIRAAMAAVGEPKRPVGRPPSKKATTTKAKPVKPAASGKPKAAASNGHNGVAGGHVPVLVPPLPTSNPYQQIRSIALNALDEIASRMVACYPALPPQSEFEPAIMADGTEMQRLIATIRCSL